jgi:hypothetical protein
MHWILQKLLPESWEVAERLLLLENVAKSFLYLEAISFVPQVEEVA